MQYFFDTSAVVKVYHQEEGSNIILPIYSGNDAVIISELCKVEFCFDYGASGNRCQEGPVP
jgi:hypothetical protein